MNRWVYEHPEKFGLLWHRKIRVHETWGRGVLAPLPNKHGGGRWEKHVVSRCCWWSLIDAVWVTNVSIRLVTVRDVDVGVEGLVWACVVGSLGGAGWWYEASRWMSPGGGLGNISTGARKGDAGALSWGAVGHTPNLNNFFVLLFIPLKHMPFIV